MENDTKEKKNKKAKYLKGDGGDGALCSEICATTTTKSAGRVQDLCDNGSLSLFVYAREIIIIKAASVPSDERERERRKRAHRGMEITKEHDRIRAGEWTEERSTTNAFNLCFRAYMYSSTPGRSAKNNNT